MNNYISNIITGECGYQFRPVLFYDLFFCISSIMGVSDRDIILLISGARLATQARNPAYVIRNINKLSPVNGLEIHIIRRSKSWKPQE